MGRKPTLGGRTSEEPEPASRNPAGMHRQIAAVAKWSGRVILVAYILNPLKPSVSSDSTPAWKMLSHEVSTGTVGIRRPLSEAGRRELDRPSLDRACLNRIWSGRGDSNPRLQLGKLSYYPYTTAALTATHCSSCLDFIARQRIAGQ